LLTIAPVVTRTKHFIYEEIPIIRKFIYLFTNEINLALFSGIVLGLGSILGSELALK